MDIVNKERPTLENLKIYTSNLEALLKAIHVKVQVLLNDEPMLLTSMRNNQITSRENLWVDKFAIDCPLTGKFEMMHLPFQRDVLSHASEKKEIFNDAYIIQTEIYRRINKDTGRPQDGDSYWALWDHIKKSDDAKI